MNILYLHGLQSKLRKEKRAILENYGTVFAPDIDYSENHLQPIPILSEFKETEFNVIIGSSMGALNAYIISENIGRPALLFNPPLSKYKVIAFKAHFIKGIAAKQIILGGNDDVVDPTKTLNFLANHLKESEFKIITDPELGHRIPKDVFSTQIEEFFRELCY
jgi:hypothetical protein